MRFKTIFNKHKLYIDSTKIFTVMLFCHFNNYSIIVNNKFLGIDSKALFIYMKCFIKDTNNKKGHTHVFQLKLNKNIKNQLLKEMENDIPKEWHDAYQYIIDDFITNYHSQIKNVIGI